MELFFFGEAPHEFTNPPKDWSELCEHVVSVQYTPILQKLKESQLEKLTFFRGSGSNCANITLTGLSMDSLHDDA